MTDLIVFIERNNSRSDPPFLESNVGNLDNIESLRERRRWKRGVISPKNFKIQEQWNKNQWLFSIMKQCSEGQVLLAECKERWTNIEKRKHLITSRSIQSIVVCVYITELNCCYVCCTILSTKEPIASFVLAHSDFLKHGTCYIIFSCVITKRRTIIICTLSKFFQL